MGSPPGVDATLNGAVGADDSIRLDRRHLGHADPPVVLHPLFDAEPAHADALSALSSASITQGSKVIAFGDDRSSTMRRASSWRPSISGHRAGARGDTGEAVSLRHARDGHAGARVPSARHRDANRWQTRHHAGSLHRRRDGPVRRCGLAAGAAARHARGHSRARAAWPSARCSIDCCGAAPVGG